VSGAAGWWNDAFARGTDYVEIAEQQKKYELMRFWLLGTWMAKQLEREFLLINLVRDESERDIEPKFRQWLHCNMASRFQRLTWEDIFRFISLNAIAGSESERITSYFLNKTVGYRRIGADWAIQKAFSC
jgi:hypothetical protein